MIRATSILFLLLSSFYAVSQKASELDSTYRISYADKIVIKLNVDNQSDSYSLRDSQYGTNLSIAPNNNYNLFVSLDYQFLGLSFGFSPSILSSNNNNELKGESSLTDFRYRMGIGHWVQGFQFSKMTGYYVENTKDFVPNWTEGVDPYFQIPDSKYTTLGMFTSYVFNNNFSYRNVVYQTEWQKKSAGSFVPTLFYNYDTFSFNIDSTRSEEKAFVLKLATAYYYTLVVHENWFLASSISPSIAVSFANNKLNENGMDSNEKRTYFTKSLEGGMQIGFASKKIVFGGGFVFDVNWYDEADFITVENNRIYGLLYFGYRFNTPAFIQNPYNRLAKKIGL